MKQCIAETVARLWVTIKMFFETTIGRTMDYSARLFGLIFLILITGCGPKGPDVVPVSGTVTKDGKKSVKRVRVAKKSGKDI